MDTTAVQSQDQAPDAETVPANPVHVSYFKNTGAGSFIDERSLSWADFCREFTAHKIVADKKDAGLFNFCRFGAKHRADENVTDVSALLLDLDDVTQAELVSILGKLWGVSYAIATTHSHGLTPEKSRMRIAAELSRPVLGSEWKRFAAGVRAWLGEGLDKCLKAQSQSYYVSSCPLEREALKKANVQAGKPLDVDALLATAPSVAADRWSVRTANADVAAQIVAPDKRRPATRADLEKLVLSAPDGVAADAQRVLDGKPFGTKNGDRDPALLNLCLALVRSDTALDSEGSAELFRESIDAINALPGEWAELSWVVNKIEDRRRIVAQERADDAAAQAEVKWIIDTPGLLRRLAPDQHAAFCARLQAGNSSNNAAVIAEFLRYVPAANQNAPAPVDAPVLANEKEPVSAPEAPAPAPVPVSVPATDLTAADLTMLASKVARRKGGKDLAKDLRALAASTTVEDLPATLDAIVKHFPNVNPASVAAMAPGIAPAIERELQTLLDKAKANAGLWPAAPADMRRYLDLAVERLAEHPHVFQGGAMLTRVVTNDTGPEISEFTVDSLRTVLSEVAEWCTTTPTGPKRVAPGRDFVKAVRDERRYPGVRPLRGIAGSPVLRDDGTILQKPGYDAQTGLWLDLGDLQLPAIQAPAQAEAKAACARLLELVEQFEWADPAPAHKSVWLSYILSTLALELIVYSPLHLFDASNAGAGKTKLAKVAERILYGRTANVAVAWPASEEEREKRLVTAASMGKRTVRLENVTTDIGGAALDGAITDHVAGRLLGVSKNAPPLFATFAATGNNATVLGDTSRRVIRAVLQSTTADPELRTPAGGFKFPDLEKHVLAHRGAYLADALTILRGFYAAGQPVQDVRRVGSFESWCSIVCSALVWVGQEDPGKCLVRHLKQDEHEAIDDVSAARVQVALAVERLSPKAGTDKGISASTLRADAVREDGAELLGALHVLSRDSRAVPGFSLKEGPSVQLVGQVMKRLCGTMLRLDDTREGKVERVSDSHGKSHRFELRVVRPTE